jgi:hypothetical protein
MPKEMNSSSREYPVDLTRFEKAQEGIYERAIAELRRGEKRSHWMWFIFPGAELYYKILFLKKPEGSARVSGSSGAWGEAAGVCGGSAGG